MLWVWVGLSILGVVSLGVAGFLIWLYFHLKINFLNHIVRIFQEKPLFIIPKGNPSPWAEDVTFQNRDGLSLRGCYFKARTNRRRGVIVFGLEYGSNRWACLPYCRFLLESDFDIFAFELRNQGESECQEGFEPLQWPTDREVDDWRYAMSYIKNRADAPRGVGVFGLSKGGTLGLMLGAEDPFVRCFVTDGAFATLGTMVPYMQKWIKIYSRRYWLQRIVPLWYYRIFAHMGLKKIAEIKQCEFPHLEDYLSCIPPRPWLQIHGEADNYIRPDMAVALHAAAGEPKNLWMVPNAKHNQAIHVAADEYQRRIRDFFTAHLEPFMDESSSDQIDEDDRGNESVSPQPVLSSSAPHLN